MYSLRDYKWNTAYEPGEFFSKKGTCHIKNICGSERMNDGQLTGGCKQMHILEDSTLKSISNDEINEICMQTSFPGWGVFLILLAVALIIFLVYRFRLKNKKVTFTDIRDYAAKLMRRGDNN